MRGLRAVASIAGAAVLMATGIGSGLAHEHREVGAYELTVGFISEPAFTEELNGLSLRVVEIPTADGAAATPAAEAAEGTPVEGLETTLQAEVIYGDQKMALTLAPAWQDAGHYQSYFIPMAAGDYSFHVWGTIGDQQIDETFTSSPEGFDAVQDRTVLQFPTQ